ncbi:hypothetical protein [Parabacteroides merdae]|nr:hypothetical protein [Parabacteroides merdae]
MITKKKSGYSVIVPIVQDQVHNTDITMMTEPILTRGDQSGW